MEFTKRDIVIFLSGGLCLSIVFFPYVSGIIGLVLGFYVRPIIEKWVSERDQHKIQQLKKQIEKLEKKVSKLE